METRDDVKAAMVQGALSGESAVYVGDRMRFSLEMIESIYQRPDQMTGVIEIAKIERNHDGEVIVYGKWPTS